MLTVRNTLSIVADGLRIVYGDEAQTVASFVLRQCRERHDKQAEEVWIRVLDYIRCEDDPGSPGDKTGRA